MSENKKETLGFQTEVKQMLHLMVHSLYSNREIFLRELVSNASDAIDKLRFAAIDNPSLLANDSHPSIRVGVDEQKQEITVSDDGIGMTRAEVIEHLGTIAKSGTREFFARLSGDQKKDSQLIGQFGVGFYSSFIIADKVTVITRKAEIRPMPPQSGKATERASLRLKTQPATISAPTLSSLLRARTAIS